MGTSVGAKLYTLGGWTASSGFSVGLLGLAFLVLLTRGPHAEKWFGWDGGRNLRKQTKAESTWQDAVTRVEGESDSKAVGKEDLVMVELGREENPLGTKRSNSFRNGPS